MLYHLIAFIMAFILDSIFGDPRWLLHPVILIGRFISFLEKRWLREKDTDDVKLIQGRVLTIVVIVVTFDLTLALILFSYKLHVIVGIIIESILGATCLAAKDLKKESMKVYYSIDDIDKARHAVSMIVGRDTESLSKEGVIKAAVETVAESTSDGVIAPMLYLAVGGPALAYLYKAANTMDSMIGYKNDKYLYFGRCAAKLDDILNFIPARISGILMVAATIFDKKNFDTGNAWKVFKRDRLKHKSPNSAHTEAAAAGALNIQLAGPASYFGKIVDKDYLGDKNREVAADDIKKMNELMYLTSISAFTICVLILGLITIILNYC